MQYGMSQLEGKQRYGDPRGTQRCEFVPEYRDSIQRRFGANAKFSTAVVLSQFRTKKWGPPPGSPETYVQDLRSRLALKTCAQDLGQ
jgi:hypothetical protein